MNWTKTRKTLGVYQYQIVSLICISVVGILLFQLFQISLQPRHFCYNFGNCISRCAGLNSIIFPPSVYNECSRVCTDKFRVDAQIEQNGNEIGIIEIDPEKEICV